MKQFVDAQRIIFAATIALASSGCGGGGGGSTPPGPGPQPTETPNGLLHVSTSSLSYGSLTPQTVQVSEAGYTGALSVTSSGTASCSGIVSIAPQSASGPSASFTITPSAPGECQLTITDGNGNIANIPVTVTLTGATLQ